MEDDLEILEKALLNLEASETEDRKSEFEGLYKNWGKAGSQEERRAQLLEIQKLNRHNKIDRFRGILELVNAVEDSSKLFNPFKKVPYRPNIYVAGFHKTCLTYSNVLMLSEWMIEKPSDFEENWFVVPCPKGVRVLVIANNGTTKFYTKYGHFKFERYTGLPGGNPHNFYRKNCCVLDGFYYEPSNTLYILDLLAWNNQPMTDGETDFRHYWMQTQLEDFPDTKVVNKKNKVLIEILPKMPCTKHYLSYMLSSYPQFKDNAPPLDGLLFYHKKAHYVAGETPLVGWIYPYMIPEVIDKEITMHPGYLAEMPADYVNQTDFIKKFEAKYVKKNRTSSAMDTDKDIEENVRNENMATDRTENDINDTSVIDTDNKEVVKTDEIKENKPMDTDNKSMVKEMNNETKSKMKNNMCKRAGKAERIVSMDAEDEKSDAAKTTNDEQ